MLLGLKLNPFIVVHSPNAKHHRHMGLGKTLDRLKIIPECLQLYISIWTDKVSIKFE